MVSDRDSFLTARRVTREEGILVGGSAGTAVWAALEVGRELGPEHVVVVLIPDSGRGYLSKLYNDDWMADFGFLRASGQTVGDVLPARAATSRRSCTCIPTRRCATVIAILREFGVSQMPVVKAEPPLVAAEVMGAVHDRELMEQAFADPADPRPARRRGDGPAAAHDRQRRAGRARRSPGSRPRPRCWCSTPATRSASSPAPTCSSSSPTADAVREP